MSFFGEASVHDVPGVVHVDERADLSAVRLPDCAAAIWRRTLSPDFAAWINGLTPQQLPQTRVVVAPEEVAETVARACDETNMPLGPERDWFIADVAALAGRFADVMSAPYLRVRLDVEQTNACRKFHIDAVTARLICTYRGTGTQYGVTEGGNDPRTISTLGTGSPVVLRGTRWQERPNVGLRHRSPPIEGTGETRLLLVLDPLSERSREG